MTLKEIDEMIKIVDKNGDGRISYSEFRYVLESVFDKMFSVLNDKSCRLFNVRNVRKVMEHTLDRNLYTQQRLDTF